MKFPREPIAEAPEEPFFLNPKTQEPNWLVELKAKQRRQAGEGDQGGEPGSPFKVGFDRYPSTHALDPSAGNAEQAVSRPRSGRTRPSTAKSSRSNRSRGSSVVFVDSIEDPSFDTGIRPKYEKEDAYGAPL